MAAEQISVGSCPTCGGPARFTEPLTEAGPTTTHVDLSRVPLERVQRELNVLRDGASGVARIAYADALGIIERELDPEGPR